MAEKDKKSNPLISVATGSLVLIVALVALWKNETRFDYYRAAREARVVTSLDEAVNGEAICYTGPMDQSLTLTGDYVESFTGYLTIDRDAEIYAWDEERDDDSVTYRLRWMNRVESNSRNRDVQQVLSDRRFSPTRYVVGDLPFGAPSIELVDEFEVLSPSKMKLSEAGEKLKLKQLGDHVYLPKQQHRDLGDERLLYSGIPVPSQATYFGSFRDGIGIPDARKKRDGFINSIIGDSGVLFHLAAGDRDTSLSTIKSHLRRLKWSIRGGGTIGVIAGLRIVFNAILGFLFHLPVIGKLAEDGSTFAAICIGLPLSIFVISISFLWAHPLLLVLLSVTIGGIWFYLKNRAKSSQQTLKQSLDEEYGHTLSTSEIKELEFIELARVSMSDAEISDGEDEFLKTWATKHGWSDSRFEQMLTRAAGPGDSVGDTSTTEGHLNNLIRLAMSDGNLSSYELKAIRHAGQRAGFDKAAVNDLIGRVRSATAGA